MSRELQNQENNTLDIGRKCISNKRVLREINR